jgi:hypothetical protein
MATRVFGKFAEIILNQTPTFIVTMIGIDERIFLSRMGAPNLA